MTEDIKGYPMRGVRTVYGQDRESMAAEIERLRAALQDIVDAWDACTRGQPPSDYDQSPAFLARRAKAALDHN